jgi:3-dehydroquinate dehydratase-2
MKIAIVNGPNLNLTGSREVDIYGKQTFESLISEMDQMYDKLEIVYLQSNVEGELINFLHSLNDEADIVGILLNAGAYTHTSLAIADAVAGIKKPVVEIHLSNIFQREDFRQISFIAPSCEGSISGFGMDSYRLGLEYFMKQLK